LPSVVSIWSCASSQIEIRHESRKKQDGLSTPDHAPVYVDLD
jgi:hypothetical protein